jgi:LacI family fructose operon transcriptional repressor
MQGYSAILPRAWSKAPESSAMSSKELPGSAQRTPRRSAGAPRSRHVTIYDIARRAGASAATVSLVLNEKWREQRISAVTAEHIRGIAEALRFRVDLRARALRLHRSGLLGLIIPMYQNRFFAALAEAFQAEAARRGACPLVVSCDRDQAAGRAMAETLLAHQVEVLFVAGIRDPAPLDALCLQAGVRCVNIDLPGPAAPSVLTDNRAGARLLAERLLARLPPCPQTAADRLFFVGGIRGEYATSERLKGWREALRVRGMAAAAGQFALCGYEAEAVAGHIAGLVRRLGRLPAGLFINSITALEGAVRVLAPLCRGGGPMPALGCFDWDPFAACLPFPVLMMRQDAERLVAEAFRLADADPPLPPATRVLVPARLVVP